MNKRGATEISLIEIGKGVVAALIIFALVSVAVNLFKLFTGQPEQADRASYENFAKAVQTLKNKGDKQENIPVQLSENLNIFGFDKASSGIEVNSGLFINPTYKIATPSECRSKACLCLCDDRCQNVVDCKYTFDNVDSFLVTKPAFNGNEGKETAEGEQLALVGKLGITPGMRDFGLRLLNIELGDNKIVLVTEAKKP